MHRADNLILRVPSVMQSKSLNLLEPLGLSRPVMGLLYRLARNIIPCVRLQKTRARAHAHTHTCHEQRNVLEDKT
jgi:hypothetical protein